MRTKLRYSETVSVSGAAGGIGQYYFRLNSLFDPNLTGAGHQPMYFDQFALMYKRYRVHGCHVTARFVNKSDTVDAKVALIDRSASTAITSLHDEEERGSAIISVVGTGGSDVATLSRYYSMSKMLGPEAMTQSDTQALNTANPTLVWHMAVASQDATDVAQTTDVSCLVTMVFYAEFLNMEAVAAS